MAPRSRKARPAPAEGDERMRRGYARAEARNAAVRAELEPLAPGERPAPLVAAVVVAAALGARQPRRRSPPGCAFDGSRPSAVGTIVFCAIMFGAAAGMWRASYWAVLGFEALLGLTVAAAGLAMLFASGVAGRGRSCLAHRWSPADAVLEAHPRDGQAPGARAHTRLSR